MMPKTIMHLMSGGLDSTVMLYDLRGQGHNVHCVLFDYKQRHVQELTFAHYHCQRLGVLYTTIALPQLRGSELTDGSGTVIVPNRNAIMLSMAVNLAVAAGADTVTFACNADDEETFPDCRRAFVESINQTVRAAGYNVEICTPYLDKRKWWIASLGREMGVQMNQTWSCYRGGAKPCGECSACQKREAALK